jgi:hypothetical protein
MHRPVELKLYFETAFSCVLAWSICSYAYVAMAAVVIALAVCAGGCGRVDVDQQQPWRAELRSPLEEGGFGVHQPLPRSV